MGRVLYPNGYEHSAMEMRGLAKGLSKSQSTDKAPRFSYRLWMTMEHLGLDYSQVARMTNAEFTKLPYPLYRGQKILRITVRDYVKYGVSPKEDVYTAMSKALGVDELWLLGHDPTEKYVRNGFILNEEDYPFERFVNEIHPCQKPKYEKKGAYKFESKTDDNQFDGKPVRIIDGSNMMLLAYQTSDRRVHSYKRTVSQVTLQQRIKYCRLLCGMSREELSRRMTILKRPISVDYIAALEGDSEVLAICDKWTLNKIARCMKVPVDFLTGQKIIDVEDDPEFKDAA